MPKLPVEPAFTPEAVIMTAVRIHSYAGRDGEIVLRQLFEDLNQVYPGVLAQFRYALVDAGLLEPPL